MAVDMKTQESLLRISWHDSAWIPVLNAGNVMEYFSERSNPFYDRTCNNEIVKMQRLNPDQLTNMTGLEYILLHVQEPILYVVRKQHRHSTQQTTPIADYYIIAGVVYQAPDLGAVVNSRLLNTIHHLEGALEECLAVSRYHPSRGYSWDWGGLEGVDGGKATTKKEVPEESSSSSTFQRQRVDLLLLELSRKFPPKQLLIESSHVGKEKSSGVENKEKEEEVKDPPQVQVKTEPKESPEKDQQKILKPPEKKPKL